MAKTEGIAAGLTAISSILLDRDREKREFSKKVKEALFEQELKSGRLRMARPGEPADASVFGMGLRTVSPEEKYQAAQINLQRLQSLLPESQRGNFIPIPEMDAQGNVTGYSLKQPREGLYMAPGVQGGALGPPGQTPPSTEQPPPGKVKVVSPNGEEGYIPVEDLEQALKEGYRKA